MLIYRAELGNAGRWVCAGLLVFAAIGIVTAETSGDAAAQTERAADTLPLYDDEMGRPRSRLVDIEPLTPAAPPVVEAPAPSEPEPVSVSEPVNAPIETVPDPEPTVTAAVEPAAEAPPAATPALPETVTVLFAPGGSELPGDGQPQLDSLVGMLDADAALRLQLKAYADGSGGAENAAKRLSLSRAVAVRGYLIDAGLSATRIDIRVLGSKFETGPADRVDVIPVK